MNRHRAVGALIACCIILIAVICGPSIPLFLNNGGRIQTVCPRNESFLIPPENQQILSLDNVSMEMENTTARIFNGSHRINIEREGLIVQINEEDTRHFLQIMSLCKYWNRCSTAKKNRCIPIGTSDLQLCHNRYGVLDGIAYNNKLLLSKQFTDALYVWVQGIINNK